MICPAIISCCFSSSEEENLFFSVVVLFMHHSHPVLGWMNEWDERKKRINVLIDGWMTSDSANANTQNTSLGKQKIK